MDRVEPSLPEPSAFDHLTTVHLRRAREGDRESLAWLVERFTPLLIAQARRRLGPALLRGHDPEDVVQDVFIQIWDKAKLYDPAKGKPLTWALTLTRNRSIDRIRAIQRRSRLRDDFEKESTVDESTGVREALSEVDASEKGQILRDAVSQLSRQQRKVIELAFFGGLTQSEIAEKLGEPLGTVKARARRGLMKLKEILGHQL